jgi:hypothetical protein
MECKECGKQYIALANHLIQTHGIVPDDYRRKHNIPLMQPLADDELRSHLSSKAQLRLLTQEGVAHLRRMLANCDRQAQTGKRRRLPKCSIEHCLVNNERKSTTFRERKLPAVLVDWNAGMSIRDVSIKHLVADATMRKWVQDGYLPKRKMVYVVDASSLKQK